MGLDLWAWCLAAVAAFAVGMSKGGLSMVGVIAVPLMAMVMSPVQAAGILLPVYVVSDIGGLLAFRRSFDRKVLATLLPGAVVGIVLGWATAHLVDERRIGLIVGLVGLAFALNSLLRRRAAGRLRQPNAVRGGLWGMLSGYTSFVSHSGAPPYQVYAQPLGMSPMVFAGTTTIFFAVCNAIKLIPYAMLGQLSLHNLGVAAVLMVPGIAGVLVGVWLLKRMPADFFYKFITWALMIVSLRLIWQGL